MTLEAILITLFLILPGAHARQSSLRTTPIPWSASYRSTLQELAEVVSYAVVNGALTVALLAVVGVAFLDKAPDFRSVIERGTDAITPDKHFEVLKWLMAYLLASLVIAEITGSTQFWARTRAYLADLLAYADTWTHTTIWYSAIESARADDANEEVSARVVLADGTEFAGVISEYPVLEDDKPKDFVLTNALRRSLGAPDFAPVAPATHVLLNTKSCAAVLVGPNSRPPEPRRIELYPAFAHGTTWVLLLLFAAVAYLRLDAMPNDDLVAALQFATAWLLVAAVFGFVRMLLRELLDRWDETPVQVTWLVAGVLAVAAASAMAMRSAPGVVVLAILSLIALVVLVVVLVRQPTRAAAP